jgi:drug/metabolite transporter (DMT)-like permease
VSRRDLADLLMLAALWGASFLFMRLGASEFGPVALVFLRVAGASALLLPWLLWRGEGRALLQHWRPVAVVGLVNSTGPFLLFAVASLALTAGLMSVFNATAPLWAGLIGWLVWREKLDRSRVLGLAVGLAGVVALSWGKADLRAGELGVSPALGIAACVGATLLYGLGANLARRQLQAVPPMAVAAGSQLAATLSLAVPAWWWWPVQTPGATAWAAVALLALACTGLAYALFFRLIANVGATKAISVTFLIPAFAMGWGALFLGEWPTGAMLAGCAVILLGTALATGVMRWPARRPGIP